jgi:HEAT repeat protein
VKGSEDKMDSFDEKALEEEVKSTRALIQTFLQTVKAYRLYEASHPLLSKFLDRLRNDFDHYFHEFDSFSLQVGEYELFFRGKVVYESQDVKESLAFAFYKDGIREIRFLKGLEFEEIVDFLNIVRKSDHVNRLEDDLVTLLWEKDFSHIGVTTVDDLLEANSTVVPATEEELLKGLEYRGSKGEADKGKANVAETTEAQPLVEELKQELNLPPDQSLVQACQLNPNEMMEINRKVQQEQHPEYLYVLIHYLIEILLHLGEDMDAYENMISYFGRTIESLLEQKEVEKAVAILKDLEDTMESMALKDKQILAIQRIFETSSGAHYLELIGKAIKANEEVKSEPILQYLRLITKKPIEPLCQLLGELESAKWRKVVTDLLVEFSREDIQPLIKFLSDRNPIVVRQILSILEKVGHPSTVKYLGSLVTHRDSKVRELTLQLLTQFGDKGKDLIQKFLRDPVAEIRGKASIILARMAKKQAVKPLVEIILSEEFYKRDYEEKASFFKALGETGSKEVIPALKEIANKRTWFKRAKWEEMRICATNTLKMLGA